VTDVLTVESLAAQPAEKLAVCVRGLVHKFVGLEVISRSNLNVAKGEFVSIVGPSGCGKTTLLNLIAGLIPLQEGSVFVSNSLPREGRADIAYMLARDSLLPWKSALANAEFAMRVRGVRKLFGCLRP
jgi:NitT/TauT family transport system ATP-binding protein